MIGKTVSHYRIVKKLGQGGMGVVYQAHDLNLDRLVALKFLPPALVAEEEAKQRFIREAKAASALDHPCVCNIHEIGESDDGQLFICMGYYEGETLKEKLQTGPLQIAEAIHIAIQISQALAMAHGRGIVHRDIKPANVIITTDGIAKVLDFGLATLAGQARLTKSGSMAGTLGYTSPEQISGEDIDRRSDIFSLGILLFEMVVGEAPFRGEFEAAILYDIVHTATPSLREKRPELSEDMERVVGRALEKNRESRYQCVEDFLGDLKQVQAGIPVSIAESSPAKPSVQAASNLPRQLTSFIGREREVEELRQLLSAVPLVTLTGIGGCGKTRLALQVASGMHGKCPDGIWLVELGACPDVALVSKWVASVLSLREEPNRPLITLLAEHLKAKRLLLVLDNCEHLIEACAGLSETLLRNCSGLRILATSREALGVAGESVYKVQPLPSPNLPGPPVTKEELDSLLSASDAMQLFVERAASASSSFSLSSENAVTVAKVCRQLEGIPLALELAAARVRTLSVEQIHSRLDDRFGLLSAGLRSGLPHHQTLKATIDWSYDLLAEKEKTLLRRLSVFAGGWTVDEVEGVCSGGGVEKREVLNLLTKLVDKSMVMETGLKGERRFQFLETIRQYAGDELDAAQETQGVRSRHRDYFLELAERAEQELLGENQAEWFHHLETAHDNLRVALGFCHIDPDGADLGLRLAGSLARFWDTRGHFAEGHQWLETMLNASPDAPEQVRAKASLGLGILFWDQGEFKQAARLITEGLTLYQKLGHKDGTINALNNLGKVAWAQGDYESATRHFEEALGICRELNDEKRIAATLGNLGVVAQEQNNYGKARELYEQSLAASRRLKDKQRVAMALNNLGNLLHEQGEWAKALVAHQEALAIREELNDRDGIGSSLFNLGNVALALKDVETARAHYQAGLLVFTELDEKRCISFSLDGLGYAATALGEFDRAARLFGAAEALREAISFPLPNWLQAAYEANVAAVRAALGEEQCGALWEKGRKMTKDEVSRDTAT